jgi:hypothetical protein
VLIPEMPLTNSERLERKDFISEGVANSQRGGKGDFNFFWSGDLRRQGFFATLGQVGKHLAATRPPPRRGQGARFFAFNILRDN